MVVAVTAYLELLKKACIDLWMGAKSIYPPLHQVKDDLVISDDKNWG